MLAHQSTLFNISNDDNNNLPLPQRNYSNFIFKWFLANRLVISILDGAIFQVIENDRIFEKKIRLQFQYLHSAHSTEILSLVNCSNVCCSFCEYIIRNDVIHRNSIFDRDNIFLFNSTMNRSS